MPDRTSEPTRCEFPGLADPAALRTEYERLLTEQGVAVLHLTAAATEIERLRKALQSVLGAGRDV
jgi:hypothetical protein